MLLDKTLQIAVIGDSEEAWLLACVLATLHRVVLVGGKPVIANGWRNAPPELQHCVQVANEQGRLGLCAAENANALSVMPYYFIADAHGLDYFEMHIAAQITVPAVSYLVHSIATPVGGTAGIASRFAHCNTVHLPLFTREGQRLNDLMQPDLLVLGGQAACCAQVLALLQTVITAKTTHVVNYAAAELIRISLMAFLATRVSFINELANITVAMGVDIRAVERALKSDRRIGEHYLESGVGFGGEKFFDALKDYQQLFAYPEQTLIHTVANINTRQQEVLFQKLWRHYDGELHGMHIGILGGAYKPGSSSIVHSALHKTLPALLAQSAKVVIYDPQANAQIQASYGQYSALTVCATAADVIAQCDAVLVLTAWPEFNALTAADFAVAGKQRPLFKC